MSTGESIGMMEGAFFVSKGVILDWMNELLDVSTKIQDRVALRLATFTTQPHIQIITHQFLLQLQLTKIEQCATGSVYCQIMDAIYPGSFNLSKVKWGAKFDYEFVENYKVLQSAFDKNGIKKHIEVDKLVKAKYQDNLEFCQWIKRYFDLNYSGEPYNALQRRKGANIYYIMGGNKVAPPQQKQAAMSGGTGKTYSGKPSGAT